MALALPAVFAACTSDDLLTENNAVSTSINGEMVELEDNFALNLGRNGGDEAATRSAWGHVNNSLKFFWYPMSNGTWNQNTPDKVGLCWYGTDGDKKYATSNGEVYTNYMFTHFGWKILGTEFDYDTNTSYAIIQSTQGGTKKGDGSTSVSEAKYTLDNYTTATENQGKWDGSQGLFKTENKSIFKGDYIVYTPYQENMVEIGHIPAIVDAVQYQSNAVIDSLKNVGKYTVSYGKVEGIDGGVQAEGLKMRNLTNVVRISIANKATNAINLKKVILLDKEGKGFYTQNYLSATKIFANQNDVYQTALNTNETVETTNAISVEFASNLTTPTTANMIVPAASGANAGTATACIVAMPTTIADMAVVLVNQDGKAKIVDVQNFTIARGGSAKVNVEIKDANEFNTAIVTSESEWDAAKINTANIVVLGQVNIANTQNLTTLSANKKTTVTAIGKESGLIFNNTFTLNSDNNTLAFDCVSTFNKAVTITAGTLSLNNAETNAGVTVTDSLVVAGDVKAQNGMIQNQANANLVVEGSLSLLAATTNPAKTAGQLQNAGNMIVAADAELINYGTVVNTKQLTNNGTITNEASFYNQSMLTNNVQDGFVNNADFYDQIGSQFNAFNKVSGNGNYLCDVQSDENNTRLGVAVGILAQQTEQAKKIIRFTDTTTASYDLDAITNDIDVQIDNSNAKITIDAKDVKFIKSLTVKQGKVIVDEAAQFNMNALTIAQGATAEFENNSITSVKSPVVNEGTFKIVTADTGKLAGIVYCPPTVDASKGSWTGFVTYKSNFDF